MSNSHKESIKKRFMENGLKSFNDQEILDLLLSYSTNRGDSEEISKIVMNKFGNLCRILDADIELLKEIKELSVNSTVLIKLIPQISNKYFNSISNSYHFDTLAGFEKFAIEQYIGIQEKIIKAIFLKDNMEFIACDNICTYHCVNIIELDLKKLVERAESHNSFKLILMHNNPSDSQVPTEYDKISTRKAVKLLTDLKIKMVDHVIVSKNSVFSMKNAGYLE